MPAFTVVCGLIPLFGTLIARCPFEVQGSSNWRKAVAANKRGNGAMTSLTRSDRRTVRSLGHQHQISVFPALWIRAIFQALLNKRDAKRAYKRAVDDRLAVMFCGFPDGLLPSVKTESTFRV